MSLKSNDFTTVKNALGRIESLQTLQKLISKSSDTQILLTPVKGQRVERDVSKMGLDQKKFGPKVNALLLDEIKEELNEQASILKNLGISVDV